MKKLLVLANEFPYGTWEPYMEIEEKYYTNFNKVWIASLQLRDEHARSKRTLTSGAEVIPVKYKSKLLYFLNALTTLTDDSLYKELAQLKREGRLSMKHIVDLFVFLSRSHHEARVIDRYLRNENKNGIVLYSYRFEYQPYVAILLKRKWGNMQHIVCRAHRYDIREEAHKNNYIPLRKYILHNVDCIFPCSNYWVKYIQERYGDSKAIVSCRYLGTADHGEGTYTPKKEKLKIVSCSNVVEVKRLDKIVTALSMIKDIEIEWTHYGDGPLMGDIKILANEKLGSNINVIFVGHISNSELMNEYKEKSYHVFINVSSSEGVPVSIMEATSFGIPCIATDVGGTSEIINKENGILLPPNVSNKKIADSIRNVFVMEDETYLSMRKKTRAFWNENFNADKNYSSFMEELS